MGDTLSHDIKVIKRNHVEISGVKEVMSFDDISVVLMTVCGELEIGGNDMHVSVLDTEQGIVVLEGQIESLIYSAQKTGEKKSVLASVKWEAPGGGVGNGFKQFHPGFHMKLLSFSISWIYFFLKVDLILSQPIWASIMS